MSRKVPFDTLTDAELKEMSDDLEISQEASKYAFNQRPKKIPLYATDESNVYIPFAYKKKYPRPNRENLASISAEFVGTLRPEQKEVKTEAIKSLNNIGAVMISCYCGFGKTISSICIATKLNLRVLIICNRIVLLNQWKNAINTFCPNSTVSILGGKNKNKNLADFNLINATNVPKLNKNFYSSIGTLIVDEAHLILAEKLSKCMQYIIPRYIIGLSATPYRMDGLNALFDLYFGREKIIRKLFRKHTVYKLQTSFRPESKTNIMGKLDWGSILESQCNDTERNELILKIIKTYQDRVFLVLCKRVEQAKYLVQRLQEEKEDVTSLIGSNQTYTQSSRILIGTVQKAGTGFDHPRLNAMILASDVEQYFVQYLGRVFRRQDTEPVIFDLVDRHYVLEKHFETRQAIYEEHGGEINIMDENLTISGPNRIIRKKKSE